MHDFQQDITLIDRIAAVPTILDVICRTTGMGFAAVARVTEERWIVCSVRDEIQFGLKPGGELEVRTTLCDEIRRMREPVLIDHVAEDPFYSDHPTPRMYGFQSYISMPIFLRDGSFFGTLCAIDPRPAKVKTPEVIGMFKLFAELIAFHIDTAERLIASEATLLAEREVSELREQFIAVLGHDLRNPLNAISTGATILKRAVEDPRALRAVELMEGSVARMSGLIEDVMDFARGRLGGGIALEHFSREPIGPVLQQVIDEVQAIWPERRILVEGSLSQDVPHDRRRLAQLFTNLLANAMTHGREDQPVSVHISSRDGVFELAVVNAAEPIPPESLKRLFQPFSRGSGGPYQQGLGLGLYIAAEIARAHGGELKAVSDAQETRFTFTMPLQGTA